MERSKWTDFVAQKAGSSLAQVARAMTNRSSRAGFTLLELMVVVAIIGIVMSMAAATATQIGARNATQNAASDLSSLLQNARARAEQRGSDVYVLVYPRWNKKLNVATGGSGAVFVFEDGNGDFLTSTGTCTGAGTTDCGWGAFNPPTNIKPRTGSTDRIVQAHYLDDDPKQNAKFGKDTVAFAPPFTAIGALADTNGCSFCGAGTKGAVVFTGEQQLRFLDASGLPVAQRVAGLAVQGVDNPKNTFLFGLVGATGLVTLVK